ncbi:hypothetical protein [Vallitalea guaymasensis]|nr:hypothetical protein [Vallitalea guaymasensis]
MVYAQIELSKEFTEKVDEVKDILERLEKAIKELSEMDIPNNIECVSK